MVKLWEPLPSSPRTTASDGRSERADGETKDQLGLDQIGLPRIRDRSDMPNRCCDVTTVADFGLKGPFEP